jgi:hypothetical protein
MLSVTGQRGMRTAWDEEYKKKGEKPMARFTIMRIYEVPADDRIEATDRMLEALELGVEKQYHVRDVVKKTDDDTSYFKPVDLTPTVKQPARWGTIFKRQLTGKW